MKKYLIIALAVINLTAYSQIHEDIEMHSKVVGIEIPLNIEEKMNGFDINKASSQDEKDKELGRVPRFGFPYKVKFNLENSGRWVVEENGDRTWFLKIRGLPLKDR